MSADAIDGPRPLTPEELAGVVRKTTVHPDVGGPESWDHVMGAYGSDEPAPLTPEELASVMPKTTVHADAAGSASWDRASADAEGGSLRLTPEELASVAAKTTVHQPDAAGPAPWDHALSADAGDAPRPLTPQELAGVVRTLREFKHWSQETLAAMSGLSLSVVQRVEAEGSADLDTCCALAHAFQFEDVHAFSKPYGAPSPEEIAHAREQFEREHIDLAAHIASAGSELGLLFEAATMDNAAPAMKLTDEATNIFTALVQTLRTHRDAAERCGEADKLDRYAEIQGYLDALAASGVTLCYARWDTKLPGQPAPVTVAYLAAYPRGHEPERLIVPRRIRAAAPG